MLSTRALAGLSLDDGFAPVRTIALDDPRLVSGLHGLEEDGHRWTAGRAFLPAAMWADLPEGFYLRLDLAAPALARWVMPKRLADRKRIVLA